MSFFVRRKSWKKSNAEKNCAKANLTADDVLQKNIAKKKYKKKSYCRHFPARSGPEQCNNQKSSFVVCTWPGSRKHKIKVSCLYFFPGQKVFIPKMCCPPPPPPKQNRVRMSTIVFDWFFLNHVSLCMTTKFA